MRKMTCSIIEREQQRTQPAGEQHRSVARFSRAEITDFQNHKSGKIWETGKFISIFLAWERNFFLQVSGKIWETGNSFRLFLDWERKSFSLTDLLGRSLFFFDPGKNQSRSGDQSFVRSRLDLLETVKTKLKKCNCSTKEM